MAEIEGVELDQRLGCAQRVRGLFVLFLRRDNRHSRIANDGSVYSSGLPGEHAFADEALAHPLTEYSENFVHLFGNGRNL